MSFVDTNVLVGAALAEAPAHTVAASALLHLATQGPIATSRQILREYMAVVTRPQSWAVPVSLTTAVAQAETMVRRFILLEDGPNVWAELRALAKRFSFAGKQVHDANIVATMLAHGERRLLTFNAKDFRRFSPLIEVIAP